MFSFTWKVACFLLIFWLDNLDCLFWWWNGFLRNKKLSKYCQGNVNCLLIDNCSNLPDWRILTSLLEFMLLCCKVSSNYENFPVMSIMSGKYHKISVQKEHSYFVTNVSIITRETFCFILEIKSLWQHKMIEVQIWASIKESSPKCCVISMSWCLLSFYIC